MSLPSPSTCPQCGAPLPASAPEGLCPRCLVAMNLAAPTQFTGDSAEPGASPTPEEIAPHFPQLEILECLGRGGMGVVYKARQKSLNRLVALKLLAPERVQDAKFAERFAREAQALAALNHPHIVTVHDFGEAGGRFFLLMEFVDGVNLRQAMTAGRFTPEQALAIVPPICDALQYAHEHGIVHRDIKPENLLMDKAGRVKIADFGIAKMMGESGGDVGLTESQPAGTPQYMAPEQKDHQRTDHRADIYSLGVVLYELLTGELPADKLQPPSRKVQIDVRLDEIVLRALERTPELRFQTAGEMRTQIETVVSTPGNANRESARPSSPVRSLKVCTSTLTTPAEIGTIHGQVFLHRTRGQLILDDRQLAHSCAGVNTVIPLAAIRDLSIGHYPRSANPAGIDVLSVTYEEGGQRKQVLLSPMEGWFCLPSVWNARIAEWHSAIREAVLAATGREPTTTPASKLGIPRGSFGLLLAMAGAPILVGIALLSVLTRNQGGSASYGDRAFLLMCVILSISSLAPWLIRKLAVGENQSATPRSFFRRVMGVTLIGLGLALGWLQMSDGHRAQQARFSLLSAKFPQLQREWTIAQTDAYAARNALSRFEVNNRNPESFNLQPIAAERVELKARVEEAANRGEALQTEIQTTTEALNNLPFPNAETMRRILLLPLPFVLAGVMLLLWRGRRDGDDPRGRAGWRWTGAAGIVLGLVLLLGAPVLNEFVDDHGLTKTARRHLDVRQKATQAITTAREESAAKSAALHTAEARLRTASTPEERDQQQIEVEQLREQCAASRKAADRAESEMNQMAVLKQSDEQTRISQFYLMAGVFLALGFVAFFHRAGPATSFKRAGLWLLLLPVLLFVVIIFAHFAWPETRVGYGTRLPIIAPPKEIEARSPSPKFAHISRNNHSVELAHDDVDLHYVLYFAGTFSSSSAGSSNTHSLTWMDEGSITLSGGRTFGYHRESTNPLHLRVNGKEFDLREGRVFVLRDDGTAEQLKLFPPLATARDPETLAKLFPAAE